MLLAKHVISAYYACIAAVFNRISEVFVNCILKIVYGYSGGIGMLWAWFGGLDVLVDVVLGLRVRDSIITKIIVDRNCAICNTRCAVQIYDAV